MTLLAACGLFGATAGAEEVDVAKVPAAVVKAADEVVRSKTALKGVKWTAAEKRTENKVVKYELEGESADEYGVSVTVTADGRVEEVQEQVDFAKLPPAVQKAARDTVPGFKEEEAEAHKSLSGKNLADVSYEIEGVDAKGRYVWLDCSPDGKVDEFHTEIPVTESPKAVQAALDKQFPKRQSATCYAVQVGGKLARYDFEVTRGNGSEAHVSYTPAGKEIKD